MKRYNALQPGILASLLFASVVPLLAEEDPVLRVKLEEPQPIDKNRFGISYRMSFNITAQFKNVGNVGTPGAGRGHGPAMGGGIDRFYEDGYNRVDSSGNKDGLTWFWGYKNPSQIVGDTVVMHSTSVSPITSKTIDGDPQHGAEVTYNRELGRSDKNKSSWGIEAGFSWTDVDIMDHRPLKGGMRAVADAYNLGGVDPRHNIIPPGATTPPPYNDKEDRTFHPGTHDGPGSLIEDAPNRTVSSFSAGTVVRGERHFEADLFTFRLGPYIDCPIDDKWTFSFSAGPAVGIVDGEYSFRQVVQTNPYGGGSTGSTRKFQTGSGSKTDVVFGGYLSATFRYAIDEHWGLFIGGQYTGLTGYEARANGQKVELDFARTASATFGVSFSF